jgi:hypothetical protein
MVFKLCLLNIFIEKKMAHSPIKSFLVRELLSLSKRNGCVYVKRNHRIGGGFSGFVLDLSALTEEDAEKLYDDYYTYHERNTVLKKSGPYTKFHFFSYLRKYKFLPLIDDETWRKKNRVVTTKCYYEQNKEWICAYQKEYNQKRKKPLKMETKMSLCHECNCVTKDVVLGVLPESTFCGKCKKQKKIVKKVECHL